MKLILNASGISKSYADGDKELRVLNKVGLEVYESEIIIIKGPSGSGKTTLLNILNTVDRADEGKIEINGKEIDYKNNIELDKIRSVDIGILYQDSNLLEEFSSLENLLLPFSLSNDVDHHNPIDLLNEFNLENKANNYPSELSGGERQRIALLRAIINKPTIVFADEPTGNLDDYNVDIMIKLIISLRINYKTSFVITTHDERLCDIANKIFNIKSCKLEQNRND